MSNLANSIAGAIEGVKRRLSGDTKISPTVTMENKDGADPPDSENEQNSKVSQATGGANGDRRGACGACKNDFEQIKKNLGEIKCNFCEKWFCSQCTKFKKNEIIGNNAVMTRDDIFWACGTCKTNAMEIIQRGVEKKNYEDNGEETNKQLSDLENLDKKIETKIDQTIRAVLPDINQTCIGQMQNQMTETVSESVSESVSNAWTKTVIGDESDFPSLNDPASINAPKKPKVTLVSAFKQAVSEQTEEDWRRQSRLTNVIIYRVPERDEPTGEERKRRDRDTIKEILENIGVDTEPVLVTRLGRYQKQADSSKNSSRPLKVQFENQEAQQKVMSNARNLRNAPDHLRKISICYDMTEDERQKTRDMLTEAKEKTESSSKYFFKVQGPPWALEIAQYRRRNQRPNNPESNSAPNPERHSIPENQMETTKSSQPSNNAETHNMSSVDERTTTSETLD